ncbi:MAG: response regulator transcription factor [bacterium]
MRLLLVEDESELREQLTAKLEAKGYSVDACADGMEGYYLGREYPFDVAVIDLGLPKLPGIDLIRKLRADQLAYPIIILTARDAWQDKVTGLEEGADDYLVKPFHFAELTARLNALVRRSAGQTTPVIDCGAIQVDTAAQQISVSGNSVELTAYEYRIVEYLCLHAGEVISKTELTEHVYDQDFDRDSNVIEVLIGRVRRKLDSTGALKPIETLRGRGYRMTTGRQA